jgi:uncharacterized protein (DUF3820 family)
VDEQEGVMTNNIVPFGKYKGQPVEVLQGDPQYVEWLMGQDWMRTKYPQLVTLIVNNYSEPTETPEHNKLQAMFLIVWPSARKEDAEEKKASQMREHDKMVGWGRDVSEQELTEHSAMIKKTPDISPLRIDFEHKGADVRMKPWYGWKADASSLARVEIKPSMGDEFPNVLRQMRANHCNVLYLDAYTSTGASLEQMIKMFEASPIEFQVIPTIHLQRVGTLPTMFCLPVKVLLHRDFAKFLC